MPRLWTSTERSLVDLARAGDERAFTQLYVRHVARARQEARRVGASAADAEEAVAEAFAGTLMAIKQGGGPTRHFRAYVLTAVRNAVRQQHRARSRSAEPVDPTEIDPVAGEVTETIIEHPLATAYAGLPDRWQHVLWKTEVEGFTTRELARQLDVSPNAAAALALRARSGLRTAYLRVVAGDDPHAWTASRLDGYAHGALSTDDRLLVDTHLDECPSCAARTTVRPAAFGSLGALLVLAGAHPGRSVLVGAGPFAADGGAGAAGSSSLAVAVTGAASVVAAAAAVLGAVQAPLPVERAHPVEAAAVWTVAGEVAALEPPVVQISSAGPMVFADHIPDPDAPPTDLGVTTRPAEGSALAAIEPMRTDEQPTSSQPPADTSAASTTTTSVPPPADAVTPDAAGEPVDGVDVGVPPVPDTSAPDVPVPDVPVPDVPGLDVPVPDVPGPDVPVPDLPVPDVPGLDVPVPDLPVPDPPDVIIDDPVDGDRPGAVVVVVVDPGVSVSVDVDVPADGVDPPTPQISLPTR